MVGDEVHDEPVDSDGSALFGDDVACAVVAVVVGVDEMDDGDSPGDCNTALGLLGNHNVHPDNSSVHGGKLEVADQLIPIDLVVADDVGWEALQPLGSHDTVHQGLAVQPGHFECCTLAMVDEVDDVNRDTVVAHGNDVSKFLHGHTLPHNSGM